MSINSSISELEHLEDYVFTSNFNQACDVLGSMSDILIGKDQKYTTIYIADDGENLLDASSSMVLDSNIYELSELQYDTIVDTLVNCERISQTINKGIYTLHNEHLKKFIHYCVLMGELKPEVPMYEDYLTRRKAPELAAHVHLNRQDLVATFTLHHHLAYCKNMILNVVDTRALIVDYHGVPCKLMDRFTTKQ